MYNFGAPQKCTSCRLSNPVTKFIVTKFMLLNLSVWPPRPTFSLDGGTRCMTPATAEGSDLWLTLGTCTTCMSGGPLQITTTT